MLHSRRQTEHFPMNSLMLRGLTAAALMAAFCVANTASAQEGNSPLSAIGRMFGQKPSQQTAGQDESDGPTTEQVLRIERLEAQIRQMTGTIEQLQYRNQQLENQLRGAGGALRRGASNRCSRSPNRWPGRRSRPQPLPACAAATARDGTPLRRVRSVAESQCARACRVRSAACRTSRRRSSRPSRRSARLAAAGPARRSTCRRCRGVPGSEAGVLAGRRARCRRRRRAISAPPEPWPRSRHRPIRRRTPTTSATAMCCARTTRWRKTPSRRS